MSRAQVAPLNSRSVVSVSGDEAGSFLQGLVTTEVDGLADGQARNAALLTPQGKILHEFILVREADNRFLLDTAAEFAADLVKRLTFYRLRAKVDIAIRDDVTVFAGWDDNSGDAPAPPGAIADPRLAALGWRSIVPEKSAEPVLAGRETVEEADYEAHRIALGVPQIARDYGQGEVFPHEADLDQLAGVDFDKGCFIGQEVVSRMQHRGTARSRFVPVGVDGSAPGAGTAVTAGDRQVGTMGSSAGGHGLALLRLDRIGAAMSDGLPIRAGDAELRPARPEWARFEWPADAAGPVSAAAEASDT